MKQKFRKLSFVHVGNNMPSEMSHFDKDFDAIVDGTFSQIHGGRDIDSYAVFKIKDGKIINWIAWYKEDQLSLLPEQDIYKAEDMIEEYHFRRRK